MTKPYNVKIKLNSRTVKYDFTLHYHRFQCRAILNHTIIEYKSTANDLNWTTQITTELNLNLQNDTGIHRII